MARREGFLFTINGEAVAYRQVLYHYNNTLKRCELYVKFSGTHIMRHSMARGSLEATQAISGHKDQRLVQHYAVKVSSVSQVEQLQI